MCRRAPLSPVRVLLLLGVPIVLATGCREPAREVYERAKLAAEQGDEATFTACLTARSQALWAGLKEAEAKSGNVLKAITDSNVAKAVLPRGSVKKRKAADGKEEDDIKEDGHVTAFIVETSDGPVALYMRLERGQWRVDLPELATFYKAARPEPSP